MKYSSSSRMRAVKIVSHGGVEALEVCEVERPQVSVDRVRVRVHAAGINRADVLQRRGLYPAPGGASPDIPGLEFAGEVDEVGADVRQWRIGQRVFGITAGGAQAEYIVVPESALAEIPQNLEWAAAAAVPEVFITAHDALFTQAELQMGERVMIHAAGSGVGTAAVQLARAAGAAAIYATARTSEKLDRARTFGADEVIVVADDPQAFVERVHQLTDEVGVDVILDLVGASYLAANLDALALRGRLMMVGTLGGANAPLNIGVAMRKRLRIIGTVLRSRSAAEKAQAINRFAAQVVPLLARGTVRPVVDSTYDIAEVRSAHARMESNASFGKIVLLITNAKS